MSELSRRDLLGLVATIPLASVLDGPSIVERAVRAAEDAVRERERTGQQYAPKFFTPAEWRAVRLLVDLIIPRDARSGSATDAGVPEFMDFVMTDRPDSQTGMRTGLAWLDRESRRRFQQPFAGATADQQKAILNDIAWPAKAKPEVGDGVRFFNMFRDLTASGFFSSKMGVADLQYMGNVPVLEWKGCPPAALQKLGVSYEEWDKARKGDD